MLFHKASIEKNERVVVRELRGGRGRRNDEPFCFKLAPQKPSCFPFRLRLRLSITTLFH